MKYQKENMHYACIACITIDPAVRIEEKNCKYKSKKIKMTKFINTELEPDSELESESE